MAKWGLDFENYNHFGNHLKYPIQAIQIAFWDFLDDVNTIGNPYDMVDPSYPKIGILMEQVFDLQKSISAIFGLVKPTDYNVYETAKRIVDESTRGLFPLTPGMFQSAIHVYHKNKYLTLIIHVNKRTLPSTETFGVKSKTNYRLLVFKRYEDDHDWDYISSLQLVGHFFVDRAKHFKPFPDDSYFQKFLYIDRKN